MRKSRAKRELLRDGRSLDLLLLVWAFRIVMVLVMLAGICRLSAVPIKVMSGDCFVVMGAYALLLIMLQNIYHACDIGQARVSELIMSQMLADIISAGMLYMGVSLYMHKLFDPWGMLVVIAVQFLLGGVWSVLINRFYFKNYRRPRTVVICQDEADYELLCTSPYFFNKYEVIRVITEYPDDVQALREQLEGAEVVFRLNLPASYGHGVAKLCLEMGIVGYFVPRLGHIIMAGAQHRANFSVPLFRVERAGDHSAYLFLKRAFDIAASVIGLIIFMPVMLVTAVAIRMEDHGPVIYRQIRLTKNGREFSILKFRSMTVNAEQDGVARLAGQNDSRITRVGHVIRACRIDELPQLINILLGHMSVVGPRPERPEIAREYEKELPEFDLRLQVKAGLTGLAQVYGRYNTKPYHKLQMDLMYINDMSFLKDLQLVLATIKILFSKDSTQGVEPESETAISSTSGGENKTA